MLTSIFEEIEILTYYSKNIVIFEIVSIKINHPCSIKNALSKKTKETIDAVFRFNWSRLNEGNINTI